MNFTLWKKSHVQNNAVKNRNKLLHDKRWNRCTLTVFFPPPSNLHHYAKSDTALQSEPAGFPDKSENKRGPRVEMGNATQQLGANWRSIHYSLLLGKPGLGLGMKGSYLIGGLRGSVFSGQRRSTLWSHKALHRNPDIANKRRDFWVAWGAKQEFAEPFASSTQQIWLVTWIHKEGQWKKICTYITKTLRLTLKFNDSINIQLQDVNVQGNKTDTETENTD